MPAATRIATYRPGYKAPPQRSTPTPAPTPTVAVPAPSFLSSIPPPSTGNLILLSLAILLSSGILVRTLHPKYRFRHVPPNQKSSSTTPAKGKRRRDTVVKSIILAQEAVAQEPSSQVGKGVEARGGGRSFISEEGRSRSSSFASTSSAIFQGFSTFTLSALAGATTSASSSNQRHEPVASGSSSRAHSFSMGTPGEGSPNLDGSFNLGAFQEQNAAAAAAAAKKGKGKKGKAVASLSPASLKPPPNGTTTSALPSPTGSVSGVVTPTKRIPVMNDAASGCDPPVWVDVAVQTTYPFLTFLAADAPAYGLSANDPFYVYPPLPESPTLGIPPPILDPPPPQHHNAETQTAPVMPPSRPPAFNLHASFQSIPSSSTTTTLPSNVSSSSLNQLRAPSPPASPSISPSPSKVRLASMNGASRGPSPTLEPLDTPQIPGAKSRKQRGKAASQLATTNIVPGMPRPARSRQTTDDSETFLMSPTVRKSSQVQQQQPQARTPVVPGTPTYGSPESTAMTLPKQSALSASLPLLNVKGKSREFSSGTESNSSSSRSGNSGIASTLGGDSRRNGDPLSMPIPLQSIGRRPSTPATTPSHSNPSTSASTSPYLNHLVLMTMTPPDSSRGDPSLSDSGSRSVVKTGTEDETYWRQAVSSGDQIRWEPVMGLGVNLEHGAKANHGGGEEIAPEDVEPGMRSNRASLGRTWSQVAVGMGRDGEPSFGDSSDSEHHTSNNAEGYFPAQPQPPFLSPPVSPRPTHPQTLPYQNGLIPSTPSQPPWTPDMLAAHYAMVPFSTMPTHARVPVSSASPSNLHTMLVQPQPVVPNNHASTPSRPSSRQSSLSVPPSASQHQQQLQALQQQQQQQAYAYAHAQAQYQHAVAMQMQAQQTLQQHPRELGHSQNGRPSLSTASAYQQSYIQGWNSVPPSPSAPGSYSNLPSLVTSISPTSSSFPPSASYSYFQTSTSTPYLPNGYHVSSSSTPQSSHPRGQGKNGRESNNRKTSPRLGHENNNNKSSSSPANAPDGWKTKLRVAEMEADRNGKELEIARWRLSMLEEDRIQSEIENQEALAALAHRARRAEARLKYLEEVRQQDSSSTSASGSGSPVTRPSSIMDPAESIVDPLPSSVVVDDVEVEMTRLPSPVGVKLHPLAWLDLDSVTFNTMPPRSRSTGHSSSPNGGRRGRGNRLSTTHDFAKQRRGTQYNQPRRRSTNSNILNGLQNEDDGDEDVQIVLDSPIRRIPRPPSRRSSMSIPDEDSLDVESCRPLDDDELSGGEIEENFVVLPEHSDYIGFLPPFLNRSQPSTPGQSSSTAMGSQRADSTEAVLSIPSFLLDPASPSPSQDKIPGLPPFELEASAPSIRHSPSPPMPIVADYTGRRRST